jgi:hypothetical protein
MKFSIISRGLAVVSAKENIWSLLLEILREYLNGNGFVEEGIKFNLLQDENGGRTSNVFSNLPIDKVPLMKSENGNRKLQKILEIKNDIFSMFIKEYPILAGFEYEHSIGFHKYQAVSGNKQGFQAHIDFGLIAIVFTVGKDFEYSEDQGKTWLKLSDRPEVSENSVIINFGRIYSTLTGLDPVLHRVTSNGNLSDFGYPELSKFTIGFFTEISQETPIPQEIPSTISGIHRKNWEFLKQNVKDFGEYNKRRIDGSIIEEEGLLKMTQI